MTNFLIPRHKQRIITDDTVAIRKLRELRQYTRVQAGVFLNISAKQIEAIENGRVQLTEERIEEFCRAYKFSKTQYESVKAVARRQGGKAARRQGGKAARRQGGKAAHQSRGRRKKNRYFLYGKGFLYRVIGTTAMVEIAVSILQWITLL